jgi:glycosyltransferase involved in cell wall biosynthesis
MKISVAICTYNGEKYLKEQLNSILEQSLKVDEIIICDDNSTDRTFEILNEYKLKFGSLIQLFKNESNLKSVKNFEKAISLTTGDIIFLADQDDIWMTEKVAKSIHYFKENPTIEALFSNANFINSSNENLNGNLWESIYFKPNLISKISLFHYLVLKRNIVTGACFCFKKSIINTALPFPEVTNFHHDYWLAILFAYTHKLGYIDENLISYRIHENQQVGSTLKQSCLKKIKNNAIDNYLANNKKNIFFKNKILKHLKLNLVLFLAIKDVNIKHTILLEEIIHLIQTKINNIK